MTVRFRCSNGHKLKADGKHGGQAGVCPKCGDHVVVPRTDPATTDTGIVRAIGEFVPNPRYERSSPRGPGYRNCPRCRTRLFATVHICTQCHLYLPEADAAEQKS